MKTDLNIKYDVFVSSPMAALTDKQYQADRKNVGKIVEFLKNDCKKSSVFWAAESIKSLNDFEPSNISVERDIAAIKSCEYFILIYYRKSLSSVLFEAGIASALGKKCLYFVRNRNHLPFLMRSLDKVFLNVKVFEFNSSEDIMRFLSDNQVRSCVKTLSKTC